MLATFEEFFRADFPRLVAFLINLGYPEDVAERAAGDAMVVACREWRTVRSPKAWVRRVARNQAEKLRKHEAKHDKAVERMAAAGDGLLAVEGDPERQWLLSEEEARVATALAHLPSQRRLVMALHLDGLSPAEIARELHITQAGVRSHLRYARQQLRALVEEVS